MDEQRCAPFPASTLRLRLENFVASAAVVILALSFYPVALQNRVLLERRFGLADHSFTGTEFLVSAALLYTGLLAVFFFTEARPGISKSLRFWQVIARCLSSWAAVRATARSQTDRTAVLATLLKALFGPLMTMAFMTASMGLLTNLASIWKLGLDALSFRELFDQYLFWTLFQLIVMADVFVFTAGYLVEMPALDNRIRSVDPTVLGWTAALVCYAPFNVVVGTLLGPPSDEFPRFDSPIAHYSWNFLLLALMAIYTSASVALGFKASNLTHRGIVVRGPYRLVRHPAYACKNLAWWVGSIPIVTAAFAQSSLAGLEALASIAGWTFLYVLRALTEEDHLRSVDGEYAAYASKVRYRFIPGVV